MGLVLRSDGLFLSALQLLWCCVVVEYIVLLPLRDRTEERPSSLSCRSQSLSPRHRSQTQVAVYRDCRMKQYRSTSAKSHPPISEHQQHNIHTFDLAWVSNYPIIVKPKSKISMLFHVGSELHNRSGC